MSDVVLVYEAVEGADEKHAPADDNISLARQELGDLAKAATLVHGLVMLADQIDLPAQPHQDQLVELDVLLAAARNQAERLANRLEQLWLKAQ